MNKHNMSDQEAELLDAIAKSVEVAGGCLDTLSNTLMEVGPKMTVIVGVDRLLDFAKKAVELPAILESVQSSKVGNPGVLLEGLKEVSVISGWMVNELESILEMVYEEVFQ